MNFQTHYLWMIHSMPYYMKYHIPVAHFSWVRTINIYLTTQSSGSVMMFKQTLLKELKYILTLAELLCGRNYLANRRTYSIPHQSSSWEPLPLMVISQQRQLMVEHSGAMKWGQWQAPQARVGHHSLQPEQSSHMSQMPQLTQLHLWK